MGDNKNRIIFDDARKTADAGSKHCMLFPCYLICQTMIRYTLHFAHDKSYEDQAFVGVASTGIFCRLSCPAPTAHRKNCTFYPTIAACFEAGYHPCKAVIQQWPLHPRLRSFNIFLRLSSRIPHGDGARRM